MNVILLSLVLSLSFSLLLSVPPPPHPPFLRPPRGEITNGLCLWIWIIIYKFWNHYMRLLKSLRMNHEFWEAFDYWNLSLSLSLCLSLSLSPSHFLSLSLSLYLQVFRAASSRMGFVCEYEPWILGSVRLLERKRKRERERERENMNHGFWEAFEYW